ncbi:MAG: 5-formyltetrahydrofolate cyclo-ligase [Sulfurimonas sp.]|jgi:5-formyltetrahydrofolate cyclo-ligase|nr:5-formyltetrahydrofolate cyclo-ligase [Sulfurimonadaceae bacterium]
MPLSKDSFRQNCFSLLKSAPSYNKTIRDARVNKELIKTLKDIKNKNILIYHGLNFEANIDKTINHLRKSCKIYSPFIEGASFKMVPYRLPLKKGRFGIYEAGKSFKNIRKIDIVIVPVVGIDVNMQRVGFGKGMYDRFFAKLKKRPYTIFTQSKLCCTTQKVCDSYDISCDVLITPYATLQNHMFKKIGRKNVNRRASWRRNCRN